MQPLALELASVSKSFDGAAALTQASLSVRFGEVHALLGENGAGKSTLMNIVAGLYRPDEGVIRLAGSEVTIDRPLTAKRLGIGMIHQHYKLVKAFNAVENVLLSAAASGVIRTAAQAERALVTKSEELGFGIDMTRPVASLSIAEQQRIEILKALIEGAQLLILDEPTAVLTDREGEALLGMIRRLAMNGATVVLVTHKLNEVKAFADLVTVLRGGRTIGVADPKACSLASLTAMIVGEPITEVRKPAAAVGGRVLDVRDLVAYRADGTKALTGASFELRRGEIYAIAGVGGNGQTELSEVLAGIRVPSSGSVVLEKFGNLTGRGPATWRRCGFASVPADRQTHALAGDLSITDNYSVHDVRRGTLGSWWRIAARKARQLALKAAESFEIHGVHDPRQKTSLLSGGNAQKLVIAREFAQSPSVIVTHSPSRGLDVRATDHVRRRLREARDGGATVLLISEDLDEVMLMADRIGVMTGGRIVREFSTPANRQEIGAAMVNHD